MSQDKQTNLIELFVGAILNAPLNLISPVIVSFSKFIEKMPDIIELTKSPEKLLALSQFFTNIVNTTVNGYIAAAEASQVPTADQISNLLLTLQKLTFLNDWQKQFFLMHFSGVHIKFLGATEDGHVVIVSGQPGQEQPSDDTKPPQDKEPKPEPHVPETGL